MNQGTTMAGRSEDLSGRAEEDSCRGKKTSARAAMIAGQREEISDPGKSVGGIRENGRINRPFPFRARIRERAGHP